MAIGRMYYAHPMAGERFYLRLLLTSVPGATSFEHLRTVRGVLHPTFKQACIAMGLLEDDQEWIQCLQEASAMQTGHQLRHLLITILCDCTPAQPEALWERFKEYICDDLKHALRRRGILDPTDHQVYDYGLYLIERILKTRGKSLADYHPMPQPQEDWDRQFGNHFIMEQKNYDPVEQAALAEQRIPTLNASQRPAFDSIMQAVTTRSGQCFFLYGPGGTGKTYVYNTLCYALRAQGKIVLCTASSGIAALLLIGGRTAHYRCKIPIVLHEDSLCNIKKHSLEGDLFREADLIIIDEITMQHRHAAEALDRTLQDVRNSNKLFGGVTVVFGGDFQQILPILIHGSRPQVVNACLQRSRIWRELRILKLETNMRLLQANQQERDFAKWQLEVGHGKHTDDNSNINIPRHFHLANNSVESLIDHIYPGIRDLPHPPHHYFAERSILSPCNKDVHELNQTILDAFPGQQMVFHSADSAQDRGDGEMMYPVEHLNQINLSGMPLAKLTLKVGAPVMVLRNLNPQEGVCNGSRGIVTRMANRVIEICLLTGDHAGNHIFIPRLKITPSETTLPFEFSRLQYPLHLAFAMTINKAQGQSLKLAGLDLRSPVFAHGQFYVAISRATSVNSLKVIWDPRSQNSQTKNIVFPEVLID
jgi:hypothetical protein